MIFTQRTKVAVVKAPSANMGGSGDCTPISLKHYTHATFLIPLGAKNTGTTAITLKKASDIAKTGAVAIPFRVCHNEGQAVADALSDPAYTADATGFTTNATDNELIAIEVETRELGEGFSVVYPNFAQGAAGNIAGTCIVVLSNGRYLGSNKDVMPSCLS